ncbi:MAG: ATP-binding cassette domain-containing protein [Methanothrix sp.]|nr:MAG: ATP-binding cassette domain-containing protein [Methanothrix sp.]
MQTIFELHDASYYYIGQFPALKNINLKISQGEQVAIIGSNGSGKSTLLATMNCLIYPTTGKFCAFGEEVMEDIFDSLSDNEFRSYFRKKVGYVFQNSDIQLFSSTVFDEIAFGPLQQDLSQEEIETRVEDVMSLMEIDKLRDRAPHTLSGGEKKKICIASVLANNPDVLLLDEPTAGLDPRTQLWLLEFIQELGRAGKTIVIATHDLDIIEFISNRSIVMGEDHAIKVDTDTDKVITDFDLLLETNLIHEHSHHHGSLIHAHLHSHEGKHEHKHMGCI